MAEPGITIPAAHQGGAVGHVTRIVIHATCPSIGFSGSSADGQSLATARYFSSGGSGGSAHYVRDRLREDHCVADDTRAWHAPPNSNSIGIEICAEANYNRDQWLSPEVKPILQASADRAAELCSRFGVPKVKIGPADLLAGRAGICGHVDVSNAWRQSDHVDPGPSFPWDVFMAMVGGSIGTVGQPPDSPVLSRGSSGVSVADLQRLLGIDVDGDFGPATEAAVRSYQMLHGLVVDGVVAQSTWAALRKPIPPEEDDMKMVTTVEDGAVWLIVPGLDPRHVNPEEFGALVAAGVAPPREVNRRQKDVLGALVNAAGK